MLNNNHPVHKHYSSEDKRARQFDLDKRNAVDRANSVAAACLQIL